MLWLLALGHRSQQVAARLGRAVKTEGTCKARSLEKLGLHSRADPVRPAARRGWLADAWLSIVSLRPKRHGRDYCGRLNRHG